MLGWKPDPLDPRDQPFAPAALLAATELPQASSMRAHVKTVLNQGRTSSCVFHATAQALTICEDIAGLAYDPPSRRYGYSMARAITGDEFSDAGTYVRSAMKALQVMGVPSEKYWPWREAEINVLPNVQAHMMAHARRGGTYRRIKGSGSARLHACRVAIASKLPIVFGTNVAESFLEADGSFRIDRPRADEPLAGGHAMCIVGYDQGGFEVVNSWGTRWRSEGFAWLSNAYIAASYSSDFWICEGWARIRNARAAKESVA
jgi:C1A family cysteine protease